MIKIKVYDGSFEGFLTTVFEIFEEKILEVQIQNQLHASPNFFDSTEMVHTNRQIADRVWKGLSKYCSKKGKSHIYRAFLSEQGGTENILLHYIKRCIDERKCILQDYADPQILKLAQRVKKVGREKHRMDAFVRFKETKDGVYFAVIEPDFNVLPLIIPHFKSRYADQQWIIYDMRRNYGVHYNLEDVTQITLDRTPQITTNPSFFSSEEKSFELLWRNYFKSTNIASRKNHTLHQQHVPKRYWKYLSEKIPD
ncbi:MAG: TIGR03915 family putative DNA repair protein [Marinirhabdus sp.]|nr:TIGR03915 family putative DNA repair protein [Marinirhabdus sp.]